METQEREQEESNPRFAVPDTGPVQQNFTGINIGGHTVTQATEHLEDEEKSAVRWLHWYARSKNWTWDELTKAVGYSSTTWSRIWNDKFRYAKGEKNEGQRMPIDGQVEAIQRYRKLVEEREAVRETGFVETSVWERMEWLLHRTFIRQRIGIVIGESQIGKTTCAEEYRRRNNHGQTAYCEMPPASGVQLMLRTIAESLNVPSRTGFDTLLRDVCTALDSSKLLIIDEAQRVFTTYQKGSVMRCLDTIRYIHDRSRCGLVLLATRVFQEQMERGEFAQFLKQLKRRGRTFVLRLPAVPPEDDLHLMAEAFGLPRATGSALAMLVGVAKEDGFGAVKMLLQDAGEMAAKKRRAVSWADFERAHEITRQMAEEE